MRREQSDFTFSRAHRLKNAFGLEDAGGKRFQKRMFRFHPLTVEPKKFSRHTPFVLPGTPVPRTGTYSAGEAGAQGPGLDERFLVFPLGGRIRHDPASNLEMDLFPAVNQRANQDIKVHIPGKINVAH